MLTRRSASANGSGLRRTPSTTAKMAMFAARHSARVAIVVTLKARSFKRPRAADSKILPELFHRSCWTGAVGGLFRGKVQAHNQDACREGC